MCDRLTGESEMGEQLGRSEGAGSEFSNGEKKRYFDHVQPFAHLKLLPLLPLLS